MNTKREQNENRKRQIKQHISAKLVLSGACLVLSANATISHGAQIEKDTLNEITIGERLQAAKSISKVQEKEQAKSTGSDRQLTLKTAWTNWDDWTKK